MFQYIFIMLWRQKSRSLLAMGSFLLAACTLVLLSATTLSTVVQAKQIISGNWRSSYDLVVLPSGTTIAAGKTLPIDSFQGFDGGISIQQYEQIKNLSGVEVAAPVAFVGSVQYPFSKVSFGSTPLSPGFYQVQWVETTSNGRQSLTLQQDTDRVYVDSHPCLSNTPGSSPPALQKLGPYNSNFVGCIDVPGLQAWFPNPGTYLLAAIDPDAENQLFHVNKSIVSGRMLSEQDAAQLDKHNSYGYDASGATYPIYDIPLLINTNSPNLEQVRLNATVTHFRGNTTDPQQIVARGGLPYLLHLPKDTLFSGAVPLAQNQPALFVGGKVLAWNGQTWRSIPDPFVPNAVSLLNLMYAPSVPAYQTIQVPAGETGSAYRLVPSAAQNPLVTQGNEVIFRNLQPLPGGSASLESGNTLGLTSPYNGKFFAQNPIGTFDGQRIAEEFTHPLNWLPESTYASSPVVLRSDAQGRAVSPQTLQPTTNPGSYIPQVPQVLTTLAAAERIRGNHCISIIRVRVAGNITPDEAGLQRVAQVAQEIQQRTGLRVIVTLGSSPQPASVYVPGVKEGQFGSLQNIDPIGWVQERWIAIGVGLVYLNQLGQTRILLLGAILLVCLGYLVVTLRTFAEAQRREMAVLAALGWEPWQPAVLFVAQALVLAVAGGIIGISLALLIVMFIGSSPPWEVVGWTLPGILLLAVLSALYPLWQLWRVQPSEILRSGTSITFRRTSRWMMWAGAHLPAIAGMALRNLARSRVHTLIAIGNLFLSALLLIVMIDGILALRQSLHGTLLGDYVLLQTAVPQLAGVVFAVILTFFSVADLLLLQVRERRKEIGLLQAIGWRPRLVQRLFMQEGLALALGGTIPGVFIGLLVLALQHQAQNTVPAPLIGMGTVLLMLAVSALATVPAMRAANRIPLMDILRAE